MRNPHRGVEWGRRAKWNRRIDVDGHGGLVGQQRKRIPVRGGSRATHTGGVHDTPDPAPQREWMELLPEMKAIAESVTPTLRLADHEACGATRP
jgi:hypothetical protein